MEKFRIEKYHETFAQRIARQRYEEERLKLEIKRDTVKQYLKVGSMLGVGITLWYAYYLVLWMLQF